MKTSKLVKNKGHKHKQGEKDKSRRDTATSTGIKQERSPTPPASHSLTSQPFPNVTYGPYYKYLLLLGSTKRRISHRPTYITEFQNKAFITVQKQETFSESKQVNIRNAKRSQKQYLKQQDTRSSLRAKQSYVTPREQNTTK